MKTLNELQKELAQISTLAGISAVLNWDQETYMPADAIEFRSNQLALMSTLTHQRHTGPELRAILSDWVNLETGRILRSDLSTREQALLREVYRDWKHATALPEAFVEETARAQAHSQHAWQEARKQDNFAHFSPHLSTMISLAKQKAQYLNPSINPYDCLLDEFEPTMTAAVLTPVFERLRQGIMDVLAHIQSKPKPDTTPWDGQPFDTQAQWDFGIEILNAMGYDFGKGRQDKSAHPFTTQFHPTDVRITTRLNELDFMDGLSSTMHEGGHALYEQGVDVAWFGTPLGSANSLGIHESQSRLWENVVGKSKAFWSHYYPKLQAYFPTQLGSVSLDAFYAGIHQIKPSFIRVAADEVTYNLHILIRFELEQLMFNTDIPVSELPKVWNEKYQHYLGITPTSNSVGILQDVHWSCGLFGYFPTYTLGNLYSAQLFNQAKIEIPHLETQINSGKLLPLKQWLNQKVHLVGREKSAQDLMTSITGQPLSEKAFLDYLQSKYS